MESINTGPDEEVGAEEAAEDDEKDKVQIHVQSVLKLWLVLHLQTTTDQLLSSALLVLKTSSNSRLFYIMVHSTQHVPPIISP